MTSWPQSDWLAARAAASPDALAVIDAESTRIWTYADLDAATDAVARSLAERGVGSGDHVGTLLDTGLPFVLVVHALDRLGAVLVPLNVRHTPGELARSCEKADVTTLLCDADTESSAAAVADLVADPPAVVSIDAPGFGDEDRPLPSVERSPVDVRVILFTSGTTGEPKAVPLTAGNLLASAVASAFRLGVVPDDRWLCCLPMYHMGGLAPVLRSTLYGITVVLQSEFDAERTPAVAQEYDVTGVSLVPTMLRRIAEAQRASSPASQAQQNADEQSSSTPRSATPHEDAGGRDASSEPSLADERSSSSPRSATPHEDAGGRDASSEPSLADEQSSSTSRSASPHEDAEFPDSLRFVLLGGAPAGADLIEDCERRDVPVHPTFGMTETASQVATATPNEAFEHEGTVGRPLFGTTVTVVDEGGDPLPAGETGELVVDGPTVTPGYYGDAAATEASFGAYGLHTGDVGYRDEGGRLWVLNRRDDRIVTGGENVDPGEVVAVLREHSAIRDAAVVGLADEEWGERVAALVVQGRDEASGDAGGSTAPLDAEAMRDHCRERLAGYKHPRAVAFADELPRTASGTVDRERVREALRDAESGAADEK